jgi:hypothetical protein
LNARQLADLFLANGHVWINRKHSAVCVRISGLATEDLAAELAKQFGGGKPWLWKPDQTWTWEAQGPRAVRFLAFVAAYVEIRAQRRPEKTEGDS